jgi:hypothetical protein
MLLSCGDVVVAMMLTSDPSDFCLAIPSDIVAAEPGEWKSICLIGERKPR